MKVERGADLDIPPCIGIPLPHCSIKMFTGGDHGVAKKSEKNSGAVPQCKYCIVQNMLGSSSKHLSTELL
jgi:hypothetical protein